MRYPGGKGRLYPRLISLIPPHRVFIELFAGGAAVLRHKRAAQINIAVDRDIRVLQRLASSGVVHCRFLCADAIEFLNSFPFVGDEFIYCDPPYLPSTRRKSRIYRHEFEEAQHAKLLTLLVTAPCNVLLSGYDSQLYSTSLSCWNVETFPSKTQSGWATEVAWYNYEKPRVLHDGRFLGANFRERHTIRRRLARQRKRLAELSPQEQAEIFRWLEKKLGKEVQQFRKT